MPALSARLALQGSPVTVFAPTNQAFNSDPFAAYKVAYLLDPLHNQQLQQVLEYHVSPLLWESSSLVEGAKVPTMLLGGDPALLFAHPNATTGELRVHDVTCAKANVTTRDLAALNGVVHVIDAVFVPNGVFCPDTVFAAEQRSQGRISGYGFDCRAKGTTHFSADENTAVGLAVDDVLNTTALFWSNDYNYPFGANTSWLSTLRLDGSPSAKPAHLREGVVDPQGMVVGAHGLYFTEHQGNRVTRCGRDGGAPCTVLVERSGDAFFQPADVALDDAAGLLFLAVEGPADLNGTLRMYNLADGTNEKVRRQQGGGEGRWRWRW